MVKLGLAFSIFGLICSVTCLILSGIALARQAKAKKVQASGKY